ncbi:MAG: xanthine phosphoribosyltransferase [Rhodospirillales bacterium]|jgi:xanthine phosphoribosyltransferase
MTTSPNKTITSISWDAIHDDLRTLAARLDKHPEARWQGIVAVTRGGLVPAAILARELDIRLIETVCVASYEDQKAGPVEILKPPGHALKSQGNGWLLIDDIVDTGATVRAIRELLPKAFFATLYAKSKTKDLVDLYLHEADPDQWIEFPWER